MSARSDFDDTCGSAGMGRPGLRDAGYSASLSNSSWAEGKEVTKTTIVALISLLLMLSPGVPAHAQGTEWETLNAEVESLYRQGLYDRAVVVAKKAIHVAEQAVGPNHPSVATSLNNLAELYYSQGRYAQAEPLHKRSLAILEKALGPDHPDVASSLRNLAGLYKSQDQYTQAEPLYKRSLAIREKTLGPDHPDVAQSLNDLAELYRIQGQYAQAEPLYKRSLAIWEKALGPDHPDVATSLNNLALLYKTQDQYSQAEPLYKRSLAIWEKALGPEHPTVATSLRNLAGLYATQGQYAQAEPLYKRSLAIREKDFVSDHPDVAQSLNALASLYKSQGRYAQAEPLYKRSLAILEKALGPNHPDVATTLENIAEVFQKTGRKSEAEASGPRNVHPLARISQEGLSLVVPNEDGWVIFERSRHLLSMGRAGRGQDETHIIRAGLSRLPSFRTIEELTRIVRDQALENTDRQRFKVMKHEVAPHVRKESDCVQSHMVAEDNAVRRRSGKIGPMILETLILTCAHPKDRNVGVNVEYSQRYNPGEADSRFGEKATQVLGSVEFTTL